MTDRLKTINRLAAAATLAAGLLLSVSSALAQDWPPPLFVFENGLGGANTPAEQAALIKQHGFAGLSDSGTQGIPETLAALDAQGLRYFNTYVSVTVGPKGPAMQEGMAQAITTLAGRDAMIWLYVLGAPAADHQFDQQAADLIRQVADMAAKAHLKVALYPHTGFYVERVDDALRLLPLVDRPNVGVTFNLCHYLKVEGPSPVDPLLDRAMPHLFVVSVNGADSVQDAGWDRLIQPLGSGSYDVAALLENLKKRGYRGPVGLQCYGITMPPSEHLARSITAWKKMTSPTR